MNHTQILKRAWNILWNYKALWIFGILLALTTASGGGNNSGWRANSGNQTNPTLPGPMNQWQEQLNQAMKQLPPFDEQLVIPFVIGLLCFVLILVVLFTVISLFSRVALIRMVDHYEGTGEKVNWRKGLRMGWSRAAGRLLLIDLIIVLPFLVVFFVLLGCSLIPMFLLSANIQNPSPMGVISTIGLFFIVVFLMILVGVVLGLILEIIWRVCVLEDNGVMASIRKGYQLVRQNLKDVGLLWLILLGIKIGVGIVSFMALLLVSAIGLVISGALGAGIYFAVQTAAGAVTALIISLIVGGLVFALIVGIPLLFLKGLAETYYSTVWTLGYREIRPAAELEAAPIEAEPV